MLSSQTELHPVLFLSAQSELLELCSSIFLSCGVSNMQDEGSANTAWGALNDNTLVQFATNFLSYNIKLLSVFVHIVEQREPESRDKVKIMVLFIYLFNYGLSCFRNFK